MNGVVLEIVFRHARALRKQEFERLVELMMGELLARGRPKKRRASARCSCDGGSELKASERAARATRVALPVRQERRRGGKVRAERVILGDAVLEQHPVARLERKQLGARRCPPQLLAVEDPDEREARVKRPFRKGVAADFLATSSLREPSSARV